MAHENESHTSARIPAHTDAMKTKVNVAHHFDVTKLTRISHTHTRSQHTYVNEDDMTKKSNDNKNQSQKPW